MFNKDFYPTPTNVIEMMLQGEEIQGKSFLEPSAGKGDIVKYLLSSGAESVIACETNTDLCAILSNHCTILANDFLSVTSEQVGHINTIVMNPPFSADEKHILHAYDIAPAGCKIIALCNLSTVENLYTENRKRLAQLIEENGRFEDLGQCFDNAERKTGVEIALIRITKPSEDYKQEFEGFFMEEEPEESGSIGIMPYNFIRDIVGRYTESVKIFDSQLKTAIQINELIGSFYNNSLAFQCSEGDKLKNRNEFKKDLQKSAWKHIFDKMNMNKYSTKELRQDINTFVEQQTQVPFTMKNIYKMLEIVVGTTSQRMDKALLEVFNRLTQHYDENRYNVEGWKTNSHFLINQKFIMPYTCESKYFSRTDEMTTKYGSNIEIIEDVEKALCYLTGENYENITPIRRLIDGKNFGVWCSSHFFEFKGFKKGTMHFKFNDTELWGKFNQRIAKLKGYPLYEHTKHKAKADNYNVKVKPTILETISI